MGGPPDFLISGTGNPKLEFLNLDDIAAASAHVMNLSHALYTQHTLSMQRQISVEYESDVSIEHAAQLGGEFVGYSGQMKFAGSRPYGAPHKLMDSTKLNSLGLHAKVGLKEECNLRSMISKK